MTVIWKYDTTKQLQSFKYNSYTLAFHDLFSVKIIMEEKLVKSEILSHFQHILFTLYCLYRQTKQKPQHLKDEQEWPWKKWWISNAKFKIYFRFYCI
jgi:hypothetical protein